LPAFRASLFRLATSVLEAPKSRDNPKRCPCFLQRVQVPHLSGAVEHIAAEDHTYRLNLSGEVLHPVGYGAIRHSRRIQHADRKAAPLEMIILADCAAKGDVLQRRQGARAAVVEVPAVIPLLPIDGGFFELAALALWGKTLRR